MSNTVSFYSNHKLNTNSIDLLAKELTTIFRTNIRYHQAKEMIEEFYLNKSETFIFDENRKIELTNYEDPKFIYLEEKPYAWWISDRSVNHIEPIENYHIHFKGFIFFKYHPSDKDEIEELELLGYVNIDGRLKTHIAEIIFNDYYCTRASYYALAFKKPNDESGIFCYDFLKSYLKKQAIYFKKISATDLLIINEYTYNEFEIYDESDDPSFESLKDYLFNKTKLPYIDFFEFVNNKSYREANYLEEDCYQFILHLKL